MIAYKFLGRGAVGLLSGFRWPVPANGGPGPWVSVSGPLLESLNGVHACRVRDLPHWIDDELWAVELGGAAVELETMVVARRGRLVARVAAWTPETALELAETCVWRCRDQAARLLRRHGLEREASGLAAAEQLENVELLAAPAASLATGRAALVAGYAADAVAILQGRPSFEWPASMRPAVQTPGDTVAGLSGHVAMTAGLEAAELRGEEAYGDGLAAERAWQAAWLAGRLGVAG